VSANGARVRQGTGSSRTCLAAQLVSICDGHAAYDVVRVEEYHGAATHDHVFQLRPT